MRRDAARRAPVGVAELAVVDPHSAPADETPVDVGVGVVEERLPARLDQQEQAVLVVDVAVEGGQVPCDQMVGDRLPPAAGGHGVVGQPHARQPLEGGDRPVVDVAVGEEPEEVGDDPGQPCVVRVCEAGDRGATEAAAFEAGPDDLKRVDDGLVERARGGVGGGRELVTEVVPQDAALSWVQLVSVLARLNRRGLRPRCFSRRRFSLRRLNRGRLNLWCLDCRRLSCRRGRRGRGRCVRIAVRVGARTSCGDECESDQQSADPEVHATTLEARRRVIARLSGDCFKAT